MKLSKIALLALKGTGKEAKERIAEALGTSLNSVWRWISENKNNGDLTKAKAVEIIAEETGLDAGQVLEEETSEEMDKVNEREQQS
jgi:hypothetical protein